MRLIGWESTMTQQRFYGPILNYLRKEADEGGRTRDIYNAVRTSRAHETEAEERGLPPGEYDWKHAVRCAIQYLKQKGIIELIDGRWRLAADAVNSAIENVPVCDMYRTEAESVALSSIPLGDLEIDTRLRNCLGRFGVETAAGVLDVDLDEFAQLQHVGEKTLERLRALQKQLVSGAIEASCSHSEEAAQQDAFSLTSPLDGRHISVRLAKRLERYGASSFADVLAVDDDDFMQIPGVGERTLSALHRLQKRIIRQTGMHRAPEDLHAVHCREDRLIAEPVANLPAKLLTEHPGLTRFLEENNVTVEELLDRQPELENRLAATSRGAGETLSALIKKIDLMDRNYRARIGHPGGPLAEQIEKRMYAVSTSLRETLVAYVEASLYQASERDRQIVIRRLGLTGDGQDSHTLEEVAEGYNLSRERVRQIENKWSGRLSDSRYAPCLSRLQQEVLALLRDNLGLAPLDEVADGLMIVFGWTEKPDQHQMELLCEFVSDISVRDEEWICHAQACRGLASQVKQAAVQLAAQNGTSRKLVNFAHDISEALRGRCYESDRDEVFEHCGLNTDEDTVLPLGYLKCVLAECDPPILDPEAEEIVSPDLWRLRFSTTRQELGRTALKLLGKPTHYSKVAAFIRDNSRSMPDISDGVVQHALQSAEECVSVDRGVYALAEWDVERELTHGDAIEKLLREKGQPLPKSRIIRILRSQGYKENNLNVALDQQRFVEVGGDVYDLRDRHKASQTRGNSGVSIRGRKRKSTRIQI